MAAPPANFGKDEISEAMKLRSLSSQNLDDLRKANERIAQLEAELAEAQKPLRWTSKVPKVPGLWAWIAPYKDTWLSYLSGDRLDKIKWEPGTKFYGPIPEPKE